MKPIRWLIQQFFKKNQKHFFQPDIYLIPSSLKKVESILKYYCIKYLPYSIEKYKGLHLQTFQSSCKGPGQCGIWGHAILHNTPSLQKDSTPVVRLLKLLLAPQLLFLKNTLFCVYHTPRKFTPCGKTYNWLHGNYWVKFPSLAVFRKHWSMPHGLLETLNKG